MVKLEGILPALYTCYDAHGEVTDRGLAELLAFYIDRGCRGFFVGGSTGEGLLQGVEERCRFLEAVVKTVSGQVPVIAHVGALATRDACELARFAARVGADAVGSVLPVYYRVGIEATAAYYRAIAEAAELPLLVYYLAGASEEKLDAAVFAEKLAALPRVFALKYTSPDLETFGEIAELTQGRLCMVIGRDQLLLPALTMGADAAIGANYCCMPELFVAVYDCFRAGRIGEARKLMARGFRIIKLLHRKYPKMDAVREILRMRGFETGHCRGPIPRFPPERREELRADLERLGFFRPPLR